jgi:hypothetical protein
MSKLFISYRRQDSLDVAGRIYDYIVERLGPAKVFMDVDSMAPGVDFRRTLEEAVDACDVFLAVIGPDWASCVDSRGARRLDNPADFVRIEVRRALQRGTRLVPILVGGAEMPAPEELPEDLRDLAFRHAARARPNPDFQRDMERLLRSLGVDAGGARPAPAAPGSPRRAAPPASAPPDDEPPEWAEERLAELLVQALRARGYRVRTVTHYTNRIVVQCWGTPGEACGGFVVVDYDKVRSLTDESDAALRDEVAAFVFHTFEGPFQEKPLTSELGRIANSIWSEQYGSDGVQLVYHGSEGVDLAPIKRPAAGDEAHAVADPVRLTPAFLQDLWLLPRVDRGARLANLLGKAGQSDRERQPGAGPGAG